MIIKIPFDVILKFDKETEINKENIVQIFSDDNLLPTDINSAIYCSEFIEMKEYNRHNKIFFYSLEVDITFNNNEIKQKILEKFDNVKEKLENGTDFEEIIIKGGEWFLTSWDNLNFSAYDIDFDLREFTENEIKANILMKGKIDEAVINKFFPSDLIQIEDNLNLLGSGPIGSDRESLEGLAAEIAPNFIFIRSLMDFINSAPSDSFSKAFLDISKKYPFLFKPNHQFWNDILSENEDKQIKILFPLLNRARGLTRVTFDSFIKYWRNMIQFLREKCDNTASKFFLKNCETIGIDKEDSNAMERLQSLLENYTEVKDYLGMEFPYSYKAGRLMFTMMTKNERGFDLLEGVTDEHIRNFNLPVDSQILRVALNTMLIKIDYVRTESRELDGDTANVLSLKRSDMTEIAQKAWKLVSGRLNISPTELDYYIYSIGSLVCNRFGKNCYCCPISDKCDSWANKRFFEGSGVDWHSNGGFSYAKGKGDALFFRSCNASGNPTSCRSSFYVINPFDSSHPKMDLKVLKEKYS